MLKAPNQISQYHPGSPMHITSGDFIIPDLLPQKAKTQQSAADCSKPPLIAAIMTHPCVNHFIESFKALIVQDRC